MKRIPKLFAAILLMFVTMSSSSQPIHTAYEFATPRQNASIVFRNKSQYTMTLKILYLYGGLYTTVVLGPRSAQRVEFGTSNTFRLKIKATHSGTASYHKGDNFSVTCTDTEWTEGEMSFELSVYGSGLGPKISAKEFESNN